MTVNDSLCGACGASPPDPRQLPVSEQAQDHSQSDFQGAAIVHVAALAYSHALMERDGAFQKRVAQGQNAIHEIGVVFQVDGWIELLKQFRKNRAAEQL